MVKIIIIPQTPEGSSDRIFDPSLFEISVAKVDSTGAYKFHRKYKLKEDFSADVELWEGDLIGIEYRKVPQKIISGAPLTLNTPDQFYGSLGKTKGSINEIKITVGIDSGLNPTSNFIEDDVDVNIKSISQKHPLEIKLAPSTGMPTIDQAFWHLINSHNLDFNHYRKFIDEILSMDLANDHPFSIKYKETEKQADAKRLPFNRTEAYSLLKFATERYVEQVYKVENYIQDKNHERFDLGPYLGGDKIIPYYDLIKSKIKEYFVSDANALETGFLRANADATLIELIWNYWYEEGMVNQTLTAIARRFQNIKNGYKDPLLNFALDPLRPLNNILWGYIQDAQHRLTPTRRNYEYTSEYDLCVMSTMKPGFNPADRRSKFLQSFHWLIFEATEYFVQSDNTTIRPDGFKLLNALRDTHRILAEGASNQFGDLPTVARIETLMEQWILSRPEIREFLGGRVMVPYEEPWMDRVDSMKSLQGWDNTNISFYRDLAVYGEKIILGIRYGNWTNITRRDHATNWADAFRDAIQRYIHSYYTVTGIDLSAPNVNVNSEEKYLLPGVLIREKHMRQKSLMRRF